MFGLGIQELLIIFSIVLVIFGAKRLPEIGSSLGKGIKNFKKAFKEVEDDTLKNNKPPLEDKNNDKEG